MKKILLAAALLTAAAPAHAQEETTVRVPSLADFEGGAQPLPEFQASWGVHFGFMKAADADDASLLAGLHVQFRVAEFLGIEASLGYASSEFADGDAEVTWVPFQITGKVYYKLATPTVTPYLLGGLGIISTDVDFSGALAPQDDDSATPISFHLGGGIEIAVPASKMLFSVEIRYVFQNPNIDALDDEDFDMLMVTAGLDFRW